MADNDVENIQSASPETCSRAGKLVDWVMLYRFNVTKAKVRVRQWQSKQDDPLEKLSLMVNFEAFGVLLVKTQHRHDPRKGARPAYDAVLKLRA